MDDERAVELVRWGLYAKPRPKNEAEYREAVRYVANRKDLWHLIVQLEEVPK